MMHFKNSNLMIHFLIKEYSTNKEKNYFKKKTNKLPYYFMHLGLPFKKSLFLNFIHLGSYLFHVLTISVVIIIKVKHIKTISGSA